MYEVDAVLCEHGGDLDGLVEIEPPREAVVLGREPDADREALADDRPRPPHDLAEDSRARLERASPLVGPGVHLSAQELREQIAVRAVELDPGKARALRARPRRDEVLDDAGDLFDGGRARSLEALAALLERRSADGL